jgi:hypothetical protein
VLAPDYDNGTSPSKLFIDEFLEALPGAYVAIPPDRPTLLLKQLYQRRNTFAVLA